MEQVASRFGKSGNHWDPKAEHRKILIGILWALGNTCVPLSSIIQTYPKTELVSSFWLRIATAPTSQLLRPCHLVQAWVSWPYWLIIILPRNNCHKSHKSMCHLWMHPVCDYWIKPGSPPALLCGHVPNPIISIIYCIKICTATQLDALKIIVTKWYKV